MYQHDVYCSVVSCQSDAWLLCVNIVVLLVLFLLLLVLFLLLLL